MPSTQPIIVYSTVPTRAAAKKIAREAVKSGCAACANIIGSTDSIYRWKGTIEETKEFIVLLKTTQQRFKKLQSLIVELHPYECPCVVSVKIDEIYEPYRTWLLKSVE